MIKPTLFTQSLTKLDSNCQWARDLVYNSNQTNLC